MQTEPLGNVWCGTYLWLQLNFEHILTWRQTHQHADMSDTCDDANSSCCFQIDDIVQRLTDWHDKSDL